MAAKGRAGGVLPINAAATKKEKSGQGHVKSSPRSQAPKLRLIIRRLPPGLMEAEFWAALGDEWQVGKGKIDWAAFKDGKVSRDPAKPSRPARGYLKVKDQSLLDDLSAKIKQTPFQDAKNTTRDPCLIGPPSLEFAPYNKLPSGRVRNDGRQGTIDQDQEFIDFLQSLTEPITKAAANGTDADGTQEKVTTTPLVQYLKEKKANKAKEAAEKKSSKARQQENKEGKQAKAEKSTVVVKGSNSTVEKARVTKATQDAVKAINKSVAAMQTKSAPTASKAEEKTPAKGTPAATQPPTKRERGSAAAAARMVQRDLGLAPKSPRAPRATAAAATPSSTPGATTSKAETTTTEKTTAPAADTKATAASTPAPTPPTGPRSSRNNTAAAPAGSPSAASPVPKAASGPRVKPAPQPSPGAKSAFLKHANPSQGVTEDLLRTTFSTFGTVTRCEIDKKKGLGYLDFDDTDGLRKAMASSPVKVGENGGQVVVLENRNIAKGAKATAQKAAATKADATPTASPKPAAATPVAATPSPVAAEAPPTATSVAAEGTTTPTATPPAAPASVTTPTAPRGNAARGGGNTRGGRGGFSQPGRGGGRGGFRGRGYGRGRGGAGAAAAAATTGGAQAAPSPTADGGGGEAK